MNSMKTQIFKARPYQEYAIKQIIEKPNIGLMLDMGLGKTVITLTAIQHLLYESFDVKRVLVIAPLRVAETTWEDECSTWKHLEGLTLSKVLHSEKERRAGLNAKADIYIINRENVPWLVDLFKSKWPFDMVVIDESSSFKNPSAKRFKALRKVKPLIKRMVELTGTPAPNGLMDLWSQMYLLDSGQRLGGTITSYRMQFFTPGKSNGHVVYEWIPKVNAKEEIYRRISDICVSMKSKDYITLPEVLYNNVKVRLTAPNLKKYKQLEKDYVLELGQEAMVKATSAAVLAGKLIQLASGAVYDDDGNSQEIHSAKLEALEDIAEANEGKSLLVFYWYKHDLVRLKERFPEAVTLEGPEEIRAWNRGEIPILLVHPASAGHGLNLQYGGNIVVWFTLSWSLELYQQANKRLHRSGQKNTVIIHHLITEGTIDEAVIKALESKAKGQDAMLEAVKARIKLYS